MQIPDTIKDSGHIYKVELVNDLGPDTEAYIDPQKCVIKICSNLEQTQREERLLHELCHLAFDNTLLKLLFNKTLVVEDPEEEFVDVFSSRLYGILKSNNLI